MKDEMKATRARVRRRSSYSRKALNMCVTRIAVLLLSILFVGCAGVSRDTAVASAKRELARRHCTLPAHYAVDVGEGVSQAELDRPLPLWEVSFYAPSRDGRRELYVVLVNRRTGAVFDFSDPRRTVPSRI